MDGTADDASEAALDDESKRGSGEEGRQLLSPPWQSREQIDVSDVLTKRIGAPYQTPLERYHSSGLLVDGAIRPGRDAELAPGIQARQAQQLANNSAPPAAERANGRDESKEAASGAIASNASNSAGGESSLWNAHIAQYSVDPKDVLTESPLEPDRSMLLRRVKTLNWIDATMISPFMKRAQNGSNSQFLMVAHQLLKVNPRPAFASVLAVVDPSLSIGRPLDADQWRKAAHAVRQDCAAWLLGHEHTTVSGKRLNQFLSAAAYPNNPKPTWSQMCQWLASDADDGNRNWGDMLTLIAAASCYKCPIRVYTTKAADAFPSIMEIVPVEDQTGATTAQPLHLGLLRNRYYISLVPQPA